MILMVIVIILFGCDNDKCIPIRILLLISFNSKEVTVLPCSVDIWMNVWYEGSVRRYKLMFLMSRIMLVVGEGDRHWTEWRMLPFRWQLFLFTKIKSFTRENKRIRINITIVIIVRRWWRQRVTRLHAYLGQTLLLPLLLMVPDPVKGPQLISEFNRSMSAAKSIASPFIIIY